MVPFFRILREKYDSPVQLSQHCQYLSYGDEININEMGEYQARFEDLAQDCPVMKKNVIVVGESLELLLERNQSIPAEQRAFLKILIRCYAGEVEAWTLLLEQLGFFEIFAEHHQVVKSLMMQLLLCFKGSQVKSNRLTLNKLKQINVLEILADGKRQSDFFKIVEKVVPKGMDVGGFSKFKDIIILIVDKKYVKLIDKIDVLIDFLQIDKSSDNKQDFVTLIRLVLAFISFNQLSESQLFKFVSDMTGKPQKNGKTKLDNIIASFTPSFNQNILNIQKFTPLITMFFQYSYSHDLSYIYLQLLKYEQQFKKNGQAEIIQFLKYFLSINFWFKLKYLPNMYDSNFIQHAFPAIIYPIYLIIEKSIGPETLNKILPDYEKIIRKFIFNGSKINDQP